MLSYFEYKILKEAGEENAPPAGEGQSNTSLPTPPSSLPSPTVGSAPDMSSLSGSPDMGMPDLGMGGMGGPSAPAKPLELKFSNVWDAFEKLLKSNKK